ncbi:MAG: TetR/AcrR family transcriptional regulator [Pseudomonadota bacterium]|nr:TetR/AcrR family transcriptional regulator [Pseudomonadota bacterium]
MTQALAAKKARTRKAARRGESAPPKILKAAIEEFGRHGFVGASIGEIARRAGVVKPLVHYHFKTKDQLWFAAVRGAMRQLQGEMSRVPFELRGLDPIEAFKLVVRKYAVFCAHNPWVARMILAEAIRDTHRAQWVQSEYREPAYALFEDIFGRVHDSGRFRQMHPGNLFPLINGAIHAFVADRDVLQARYGIDSRDPQAIEAHARVIVDALLYGLLPR